MDNKDVQTGIDNTVQFVGTVWGGVESAINVIPPTVLGFIVLALVIVWAWHKVKS